MAEKKKAYFWIFFAIILLSLGARALTLFLLPEPAFGDGVFHLKIVKEIISTGFVPQTVGMTFSLPERVVSMPLPAFHILSASLYAFSGLPVQEPLTKLLPLFLSAAFLLTAFLVSRLLFSKNWAAAFAFISANSFIVVFGSLNFVDLVAGLAILASFYFLLKFYSSKRYCFLVPLVFIFPLLAASKLNAAPMLAIFLPATFYALYSTKANLKKYFSFFVPVLLLSSIWFVLSFVYTGSFSGYEGWQYVQSPLETGHTVTGIANILFMDYLEFLNFPSAGTLSSFLPSFAPVQVAAIIFFAVSLPMLFLFLFGFKKLYSQDKFLFWTVLLLILANHFLTIKSILNKDVSGVITSARHFIPTIALYSIPFAVGFIELKRDWLKKLAFASFAIILLYMVFYAGFASLYYFNVKQQHQGFYDFASLLPADARIAGTAQHTYLKFYSNRSPVYLDALYSADSASIELEAELKQNADYLALSCYKETARIDLVQELAEKGFLKEAYKDSCATVYKVA